MQTALKIVLVALFLIWGFNGLSQKSSSDTIVLKKGEMDSKINKVFIDPNKNSKYYNQILVFDIEGSESIPWSYKLLMDSTKQRKSKLNQLTSLPKQWVPLALYKGKYYVYSPCDGINNYRFLITDSLLYEWDAMGAEVREFNSFRKINDSTFVNEEISYFRESHNLTITIINRHKGIAVFSHQNLDTEKKHYYLMVQADRAKLFSLIKNYCNGGKEMEFHFDKPDYLKLIGQK